MPKDISPVSARFRAIVNADRHGLPLPFASSKK